MFGIVALLPGCLCSSSLSHVHVNRRQGGYMYITCLGLRPDIISHRFRRKEFLSTYARGPTQHLSWLPSHVDCSLKLAVQRSIPQHHKRVPQTPASRCLPRCSRDRNVNNEGLSRDFSPCWRGGERRQHGGNAFSGLALNYNVIEKQLDNLRCVQNW